MSIRGKAAITGFGETQLVKDSNKSILQLASEASVKAVRDAGMTFADIDGIITLYPLSSSAKLNLPLAEFLGIKPTYSDETTVFGAASGYAFKLAAEAIAAGSAKNILVVGADMNQLKHRSNAEQPLREYDFMYGLNANAGYAMVANMHAHLYGTTDEQRAKIAVDQRFNANYNDNSLFGGKKLALEDVLNAPLISSPLRLFEAVVPCDGAIAFIVSRAEDAPSITKTPVLIDGAGFYHTHLLLSQSEMLHNGLVSPVKKATEEAFRMAGITPEHVDVCGIYDCFTIAVLLTLEDMGFCKKGEGGRFVLEHDLTFKGDFPVSTNGGQLSCGQPGIVGGLVNIIEVVMQLMGRAGERQIKDAEIGVTNSNGGVFSTQCTLVLRRM